MVSVLCPKCQRFTQGRETRFGVRHDHCGLWSWGGAPLVDKATHDARRAAHAAFDPLWKTLSGLTRNRAYKLLAAEMNMTMNKCHIKIMDAETAQKVPAAVERIRACL